MYESPPRIAKSRWRRQPGESWITPPEAIVWAAVSTSAWLACCWIAVGYGDSCSGPGAPYPGGCEGGGEWLVWGAQLVLLGFCLALMRFAPLSRFARGLLLGLYAALVYFIPFALAWLFIV